jgi:hypothetical protein
MVVFVVAAGDGGNSGWKEQRMNRRILFVLVLLSAPTPAVADYWYCEYTPTGDQKVTYFSQVFGPIDDQGVSARMNDRSTASDPMSPMGNQRPLPAMPAGSTVPTKREIGDAFARFIAGNNAVRGNARCDHSPTKTGAERDLERQKQRLTEKQRGVVQSDWTYSVRDF